MKKATALLFGLTISLVALSQVPDIRWQRYLGSPAVGQINNSFFNVKTNDNGIICVWNTGNGYQGTAVTKLDADGFIQWNSAMALPYGIETAVSYYYNVDGSLVILAKANKAPINDIFDYYVVKIDNNGNVLWENYYGGTKRDVPSSIMKSSAGGYLLIGNSSSTEITNDVNGNTDAYLVKISEAGVLEWQKDLGGNGMEGTSFKNGRGKVVESSDGSIYVLTETTSTDGDVTDNKGGQDMWLVKLSSSGTILWAKTLGGTGNDYSADLKLSPAGELYVLGTSASPELTTNGAAQADFYFARVSPDATILFQKTFGSTAGDVAIQFASIESDGSCVLAGQVDGADGDVQGSHGGTNVWLLKINQAGNILWQNAVWTGKIYQLNESSIQSSTTGGVIKTSDGGYFITGNASGPALFDYIFALQSMAAAKITSSGTTEWVRGFGGTGDDFPRGPAIEISPNVFVILGVTNSKDHDVQKKINGEYPWIVTIAANNTIKGTLFLDLNSNGIKDAAEPPFSLATVSINKGAKNWTVAPLDGNFYLPTDTGAFVSNVILDHPYFTVVPAQHNSNFSTFLNTDSFSFAVQPIASIKDLIINVIPLTPARPGFIANYEILYHNAGSVSVTPGQIQFSKDARVNFVSAVPAISSSVGDTLKWDIGTLDPGASGKISLTLRLSAPPTVNNGDTIRSVALITPIAGDVTPNDDTAMVNQIVQGSFDPNDKAENHGGSITPSHIAAGGYLNYLIRFQNLGTDVAFNIIVRDTLDAKLDWATFEMVGASHPYQLLINQSNELEWTFSDIELPYSAVNEPGSHGYIAYRIKPQSGLVPGNVVTNDASIYFDFNLPVLTNQTLTTVATNVVLPLHLLDFTAAYQKPEAVLEWSTSDEINVEKFEIERGTDAQHFTTIGRVVARGSNGGTTHYQFKDPLANQTGDKFFYRLKMMDIDQKFTYSGIELIKRDGKSINEVMIAPNPLVKGKGFATINFGKATTVVLGVVDMQGRYSRIGQQRISKGYNVVPLDLSSFNTGTYILQVKAEGKLLITRFILTK